MYLNIILKEKKTILLLILNNASFENFCDDDKIKAVYDIVDEEEDSIMINMNKQIDNDFTICENHALINKIKNDYIKTTLII